MNADEIYNDIESFNKDVSNWAYRVRSAMKGNIAAKSSKGSDGSKDRVKLLPSLRTNIRKDFGEIESVSYHFARHGVFWQKGVGKGHVMAGGKVVRGLKNGKVIKPLSGSVTRQPQDWFNSTLNREVPKLADIIADHKGDEAALNIAGIKMD